MLRDFMGILASTSQFSPCKLAGCYGSVLWAPFPLQVILHTVPKKLLTLTSTDGKWHHRLHDHLGQCHHSQANVISKVSLEDIEDAAYLVSP